MAEYLYHFTAEQYMPWILEDGFLQLTPSNLKQPKHIHRVVNKRGIPEYVDETDSYKPVVWLTDDPYPYVSENGLSEQKVTVRIKIEKTDEYKYWQDWALKNHMKLDWYQRFTAGKNLKSWWISEKPIPVSKFVCIEYLNADGNVIKTETV